MNSINGITLRFPFLPSYQTIDILLIWKIDNCCLYYSYVYCSYAASSCVLSLHHHHHHHFFYIHNIYTHYSLNTSRNNKKKEEESGHVLIFLFFCSLRTLSWYLLEWDNESFFLSTRENYTLISVALGEYFVSNISVHRTNNSKALGKRRARRQRERKEKQNRNESIRLNKEQENLRARCLHSCM